MPLLWRGGRRQFVEHSNRPMLESWFSTELDLSAAERHLADVLYTLYHEDRLEAPRLVDRTLHGSVRPDFAASLITGRVNGEEKLVSEDALIEVRLYATDTRCTLYLGIAVLGRNRPRRHERALLVDYVRTWQEGDPSLAEIPACDYGI